MFDETEIKQIVAISVLLAATKCTKFVFGRSSAPDPAGGAHDAPPEPLVGWGGVHPRPIPPLCAYGASILTPLAFTLSVPLLLFSQFKHWPVPECLHSGFIAAKDDGSEIGRAHV